MSQHRLSTKLHRPSFKYLFYISIFQGVLFFFFQLPVRRPQEVMLKAYRNTSCLLNNTVTKGQISRPNKRLIPVSFQFSVQTHDPGGQRDSGSLQAQNTALKNKNNESALYMYCSSAPTCCFFFK